MMCFIFCLDIYHPPFWFRLIASPGFLFPGPVSSSLCLSHIPQLVAWRGAFFSDLGFLEFGIWIWVLRGFSCESVARAPVLLLLLLKEWLGILLGNY